MTFVKKLCSISQSFIYLFLFQHLLIFQLFWQLHLGVAPAWLDRPMLAAALTNSCPCRKKHASIRACLFYHCLVCKKPI